MSENIKYWDDLIHNPPDCWANSTLGNLFDQRKEKQFDHLPLLAVTGGGGVVPRDTLDRRDTSNADKGKYLKVEKGDIVYNTMRMWQGVSGISDYLGIVSPAYTVCKPKSAINSSFAKYLFKLPHLVQVFHRRAQGLVDDTLNLKYESFSKIKVVLPPLPEQQKIASILTSVDTVIEKTEAQINKLKDLKKAMIQELLTKGIGHTEFSVPVGWDVEFKDSEFGRIPKNWGVKSLDDISTFRRGSFPQPYGNPEWYSQEGYPFVQVYDIAENNQLKVTTKVKISNAAAAQSVFTPKGSLIVSLQGSIGRVAITQYDAYIDRTILIFSEFSSELNVNYFSVVIRELFRKKREIADGGIIKTITKETLRDFKVTLPPLPEQQKIASILTSIDTNIDKNQNKLNHTKSLKKALMQDLLTGKVRVAV